MPRSREISAELRNKVVEAHEAGKGYKTISKVFDLHHSTVRKIVYKWKMFNTTATRPRSGRPTKLDTILREVRRSGAGNQNGKVITEDDSGGDRVGGEETACASGTMPRSKEISAELRDRVVEAHEAGKGYKTISKVFNLHVSTVRKIVYKWKVFNTTATRPRSGRPTKLDTILREVRRSGAGNQNGKVITEDDSGGDRVGGEETACASDSENETEDGGDVRDGSEGEEDVQISDTDSSPECGNLARLMGGEGDVLASMNPVLPSNAAGIRTTPKRSRKDKTEDLVVKSNHFLVAPPTLPPSRSPITHDAPTTGSAEHYMEVMLCCDICGACFPTETDLESHQAQHLNKMLHECQECRKTFQSVAGLKIHTKKKHGRRAGERRPSTTAGSDLN